MYIYVCMYIYVYILMVLIKAITTKITFSGLLVMQSSCKCEYILIFLQEYHKKMAKIGSKPIKGKGWHFSFLIKGWYQFDLNIIHEIFHSIKVQEFVNKLKKCFPYRKIEF